jgi:hypothetical protein
MLRRLFVSLIAVLPLFAACSDAATTPFAPQTPSALLLPANSTGINLDGVLEFVALPDLARNRHASKFIRAAEGGFVELNGFRVDIPAGALPADMVITIDLPSDPVLGKRVMAEFGPHGTQFNTPVTITFPLDGAALPGGALEVGRWENNAWTPLGGTVSANGKSLFSTTPHFSTYAARKDVFAGG